MKTLAMVFALGAMLGSCGGAEDSNTDKISAIDIDIAILDSPCACAKALVAIYDDIIDLSNVKGNDKTANQKIKTLEAKLMEIEGDKCVGDLTHTLAGEDCTVQPGDVSKKFFEYMQTAN